MFVLLNVNLSGRAVNQFLAKVQTCNTELWVSRGFLKQITKFALLSVLDIHLCYKDWVQCQMSGVKTCRIGAALWEIENPWHGITTSENGKGKKIVKPAHL